MASISQDKSEGAIRLVLKINKEEEKCSFLEGRLTKKILHSQCGGSAWDASADYEVVVFPPIDRQVKKGGSY